MATAAIASSRGRFCRVDVGWLVALDVPRLRRRRRGDAVNLSRLVERADLVAATLTSLYQRIDAHDRVGAELRTEAGAAAHDLMLLRKDITAHISRVKVRRRVKSAFADARTRRRAS
jgi:hypothetical protein